MQRRFSAVLLFYVGRGRLSILRCKITTLFWNVQIYLQNLGKFADISRLEVASTKYQQRCAYRARGIEHPKRDLREKAGENTEKIANVVPSARPNHPRRKPLLPEAEGRSALRTYVRTMLRTTSKPSKMRFLASKCTFFADLFATLRKISHLHLQVSIFCSNFAGHLWHVEN